MVENSTVRSKYEIEAEREAAKARDRAMSRAKERDAVSEGFKAHTKGEKLFNDITYTGLGYFGVTSFSVFMTWLFRDTKYFGPKFAKAAEKVATWLSKGGTPSADAVETTQSWLRVGALFTGGSLMTVTGVKALEDNKAALVKHFDKQIYGEEAIKNDPEIVAAHKIIEAQPKQTWASVGWSRVVAFVATISSLFLIGANSGFISKRIGTSFDTIGLQFGRWGGRMVNKIKKNTEAVDNINEAIKENKAVHDNFRTMVKGKDTQLVKTLSDFGADGLYTVITAVGLFVFTRILAPIFDKTGLENWSKEHSSKGHPEQTIPQVQTAMSHAQRAEDPTVPRMKVGEVDTVERLVQLDKHIGAPV